MSFLSLYSRDTYRNIFELFCRYWNPYQVEEINIFCPQGSRPQASWNQKADDADSHLPHYQLIRRMFMSWSCPLWTITIKIHTTPFKLGHTVLRSILKEMGIPDHLTCLLRSLYAGPEQQWEPDTEQQTGFKLEKEDIKVVYCHSA